jgi:hypothetical protein
MNTHEKIYMSNTIISNSREVTIVITITLSFTLQYQPLKI